MIKNMKEEKVYSIGFTAKDCKIQFSFYTIPDWDDLEEYRMTAEENGADEIVDEVDFIMENVGRDEVIIEPLMLFAWHEKKKVIFTTHPNTRKYLSHKIFMDALETYAFFSTLAVAAVIDEFKKRGLKANNEFNIEYFKGEVIGKLLSVWFNEDKIKTKDIAFYQSDNRYLKDRPHKAPNEDDN
jgi:hypothetical protein